MVYKLGSLFDGSGGFPLSGTLCGIEPRWAAEVEPYPIAVTRTRFPNMKHLGDISKVNGAAIEPVDIITFGSPCQDLSVAGRQAGIKHAEMGDEETTRSGLFMEAVRIIKEMREATNGVYPRFALWENVPGAFSSNKGEDFRIVCEELIKIVEPDAVMPAVPQKGWAYADSYVGDGWSIAYRTFDAQYWGVPQRRRRIHLVADFRGERAGEVLFEREGVRGYFETSGTPWQAAAGDAEGGSGAADPEIAAAGGSGGRGLDDVIPYTLKIRSGCEGGGKGALVQEDKSATLATNNDQYLFQPVRTGIIDNIGGQAEYSYESLINGTLRAGAQGAVFYSIENHPADSRVNIDDSGKVQTLTSRMGTGGGNVPMVMEPMVFDGANITSPVNASNPQPGDPCHTLSTDNRNYAVYCLQGNGIDRADTAGCNGAGWREGQSYTLNTIDRPAVAYLASGEKVTGTLCSGPALRGFSGSQEIFTGGYHVIEEHDIRYIVRRLTPTECARLQGFADRWGDIEEKENFTPEEYAFWHDVRNTHAAINGKKVQEYTEAQILTWYNKLHTDSAEYKMWGNGIALPPALYCMQGLVDALEKEEEDEEAWLM